ncbi:hypothetical protein [Kiloniella laminariae]|uniref:hypothetical protein n=1 Tax=Kiloniella laminariae TaxID=454162 RepID=UPI0003661FDE|nr:hypothetical protein [Kiloniella laminariae]
MNLLARLLQAHKQKKNQVAKRAYEFNAEVGFWGVKSIEMTSEGEAGVYDVVHNEDGNRDIPYLPKDSKNSIVCIGGSHSWGGGVNQTERYSDVLRELTGEQIVNMGHCSLGLDQVCVALMQKSAKYNPKIIVIEQHPWAIVRLLNNYVNGYLKPVFSLDKTGKLCFQKVPNYAKYTSVRNLIGRYYAYRKELNEFRSGIELASDYDPLTDPVFFQWKGNHYDYINTLAEKVIAVIRDHCRKNNIKLLFSLGVIHQQFYNSPPSLLVDYNLPRRRLIQTLDKLNVAWVDMTAPMLSEHTAEDPVIFNDGHINVKGHRIFGEVVSATLEDKGWI